MLKKIQELCGTIIAIAYAFMAIVTMKWVWDVFKPKKEEETDDVED